MQITFIGDISKDFNVIRGETREEPGGGVFHNSMTAAALDAKVVAITTCADEDRRLADRMARKGVQVIFCKSGKSTTTIENVYPDDNPDSRRSRLINGATPFSLDDLGDVDGGIVHVNPLWYPLFATSILVELRKRADILTADAQGFLRNVASDGRMFLKVPDDVRVGFELLDVLKVDIKEAAALTGVEEIHDAAFRVLAMGPKVVVLTHAAGVCVYDGMSYCDQPFKPYPMEGRTGRGDTCSAAFLYAMSLGMDLPESVAFAAEITSRKLQYPGPYRG